jgi:hypothetical protein
MTFQIEKETSYNYDENGNLQSKERYYVWVKKDDEDFAFGHCFSIHDTIEEAKMEIDKIRNIYPQKVKEELPVNFQDVKIIKELYLDRYDNYVIKTKYLLYINNKYVSQRESLEEINKLVEDHVRLNKIERKSEIVFVTN